VYGLLEVAFQIEVHCRFWLVDMFYILQKKDDPKRKCRFFRVSFITRLKHPALSKNNVAAISEVCMGRGFLFIGMMFALSCLKMCVGAVVIPLFVGTLNPRK
jgi:hypothetical protein